MNLEVWYSLSNTNISDIERLERIIGELVFKNRIKMLFKPFKETVCPHQEAAYILLKWAEKEYMGLDVLKKLLLLKNVEKNRMEGMANELGLCTPQIRDVFDSDDYRLDLSVDYVESREFFINQTTLMVGEDNVIAITRSDEDIKTFLIDSFYKIKTKIAKCDQSSYCSDDKCQFKEQGVQQVKCK